MTTKRPPDFKTPGTASRPAWRCVSSSFTAIRRAWNVRVAGCRLPRRPPRARATTAARRPVVEMGRAATIARADRAAATLFPITVDHVGQLALVGVVQQIGGGRSDGVVPHVQRLVPLEREPISCGVNLARGESQIQQNAVHPLDTGLPRQVAHVDVIAVDDPRAIPIAVQPAASRIHGPGVAIHPQHHPVGFGCLEDRLRVSTLAHRAVQVNLARASPTAIPRSPRPAREYDERPHPRPRVLRRPELAIRPTLNRPAWQTEPVCALPPVSSLTHYGSAARRDARSPRLVYAPQRDWEFNKWACGRACFCKCEINPIFSKSANFPGITADDYPGESP